MSVSIEIKELSKYFGNFHAVKDVSFQVSKGEVLGFLGPNGAGKSTTMKMITGFLTPNNGQVTICGQNLADSAVLAKKQIGYLPEGAPCYPEMTTLEFLEFIAEIRGFSGAGKKHAVGHVVERLHLKNVLYQPIDTLSKGFKRRVGLAQAIIHDPQVLILDEPTDGLDPNQKHEVRKLIREMASEKVIVLSTHILEEVEAICSRAIIIANGKLIADATPEELEKQAPSHNSINIRLIKSSASHAETALNQIPGLNKLEILQQDEHTIFYQVTPNAGQSLLNDIHDLSQLKQWKVTELSVNRGRLDEYFRVLTADEQQRN